jgi:hypothetical protein
VHLDCLEIKPNSYCTNICRTVKYQGGNGQTRPARRTHSEDIKERVQLLEKAMFKDNYTKDLGNTINKSDPNYGKPQQGTLTEFRGQKAHTHVHKVCQPIFIEKVALLKCICL